MRKLILGLSAAALIMPLAACGETDQPESNIAVEELNATTNSEALPPVTPTANVAVEEAVTDERQPEPAATKPAPSKPAPAKPKPTPAQPKPEPDPKAPDPTCLPEHRAAGHC